MEQLIISSTMFIALAALYFCLQVYHGNKRLSFVILALSSIVINAGYLLWKGYFIEPFNMNNLITPPFSLLTFAFLFLFLYDFITDKAISKFVIILNLLPFIVWGVISILAYFHSLPAYFNVRIYFFGKSATGLTIGTIYFIILYSKLRKDRITKYIDYPYVIGLIIEMVLICLLLGISLEIYFLTNRIPNTGFYLFRFLVLAVTVTLYFYSFEVYKKVLENMQKNRTEILNPLAHISVSTAVPIIEKRKNIPEEMLREDADGRYGKSLLNATQLAEYEEQIDLFFEENPKEYLDMNFNLSRLSRQTNLSRQHLSQAFNIGMKSSFNLYLNQKRIHYAIKLLKNNKDITTTELSESCGYKSRASFYKNFKAVTGYNIADYREKL